MARLIGIVVLLVTSFALPLGAQTAESTPPMRWIATPCESWTCALGAMIEGNGSPNVIVLPTKSPDYPWVVLKRVVTGVVIDPEPEIFSVECFDGLGVASARFASIDGSRFPMLVTTPDGSIAVVCLSAEERRRAVRAR